MNESEKHTAHLERIIKNLNEHWHSIELLLSHVSKPLVVDDRGLHNVLGAIGNKFHELFQKLHSTVEDLDKIDISQTLSEIKYIGNRLNNIETEIRSIREEGLKKEVELSFRCDGYELVKKQQNYVKEDPVVEPYEEENKLLKTLTKREGQALIHRLGLMGEKKKTFKEIGKIFNLEGESARRIYVLTLRKCRHPSRSQLVQSINSIKLQQEVFG